MSSDHGNDGEAPRRTQAERRADTTQLLLDATIDAIVDVGFQRATTAEICARAGVSDGALFHYFDTRVDLVLSALAHLTERRVADYLEFAEQLRRVAGDPLELLHMVGRLARDRVAVVWAEVTMAARTDADLRSRVTPAVESRWALLRAVAENFPALAAMEPRPREVWLQLLRATMEVAPLVEAPLSTEESTGRVSPRNRALLSLAEHLGARF